MVVGLSENLILILKTSYTSNAHYYHDVGLKKYHLGLQGLINVQYFKKTKKLHAEKSRTLSKLVKHFNLAMKNGTE